MTRDTFPSWIFDGSPIEDPFGYGERAVTFIRNLRHPKSTLPAAPSSWTRGKSGSSGAFTARDMLTARAS